MTVRRFVPNLAIGLVAVLAGGERGSAQERARPPVNRVAQRGTAEEAVVPADHQVYQQLLLRDRRSRLLLERARHELETGRIAEGLELIQHVLDRAGDGFVWLEGAGKVSSLRTEAQRLLTHSGRDVLETYGRLYGLEADRLLQAARRSGDREQFREVTRRFFHTKAGFDATDWLASRWLDRGQYLSAARAWSRLRDDPVHQPRVTTDVIAKIALAWHLAGDAGRARQTIESATADDLRIGGRDVSLDGWLAGLDSVLDDPRANDARQSDWPLYLGAADRVRTVRATTPYPQPIWTHSFAEGQPDSLLRLLDQWETLQAANLHPTAIATHPLVVGDVVVVRDWSGVRAMDLETGRPVWRYRSSTSLAEASERKSIFDRAYQRRALTAAPTAQPVLDIRYALAGNSLQGTLSSDGERVYAVELADVRWPRSTGRLPNIADDSLRSSNRLIALPLRGRSRPDAADESLEPLWSIGGPAPQRANPGEPARPQPDDDEDNEPAATDAASLAGHFFLGPPLPLDGLLYAITEHEHEVKLVVLDPRTGGPVWMQTLAGVDLPIEADASRHFRACAPSFGGGVLVCPTGQGLLIALDPVDGTLLWSRFCGDASFTGQPVNRRGGVVSRVEHGHSGFNAAPQIHASRVVYLPAEADVVFCLDVASGEVQWTVPRVDGEYIGAITDDLVLVVGREFCRGVALGSGELVWQVRHGTPSGRGLHLGDRYLLPLDDGRVATIELAAGREVGNSRAVLASRLGALLGESVAARADWDDSLSDSESLRRPGNLVAAAGRVVSVGVRGMSVYRETGALREELQARLHEQPGAVADQLLAAELELIEGRLAAAETLLTRVLAGRPAEGERERGEGLLRELLYLQLNAAEEAEPILARLEPLCRTRSERGRFLLHKALLALDADQRESVLDVVHEFAALDSDQLLPHPDNPHWRISASRWPQAVLSRLAANADGMVRPVLQARLAMESDAALDSDGTRELERFLSVWSRWPAATAARLELAERLIERGRLHDAELLLLASRDEPNPAAAAEATQRLATLWDARGLGFDAAALLDELATRFADVPLADGRTGREFVAAFNPRAATRLAFLQQPAESPPVSRVRVSERLWRDVDPRLTSVYRTHTPTYVTTAENPLQVLVSRGDDGIGQISVMNHAIGRVVSTLSLPLGTAYPAFARTAYVGHFFPVGDVGSVSGVSLLESWHDRPVWTTAPRELAGRTDQVRVGPAGPTFCAIHARRYLGVLDPSDGTILWERTDVNPTGDAAFETAETIIGDDQVLVVFSADKLKYVTYETATGRELRRGTLDLDTRQVQRSFGRRLVYLSSQPGGRRLKIWDPLTDTTVYESDAADLLISTSVNERELAFVLPSKPTGRAGLKPFSRLVIVDVPTAEVRVDLDLGAERLMHLNYLRAFRDGDRYYVNFQRAIANRGVRHYSYFATDTYLPSEHMQGDLYAIDARAGNVLWNRVIPQRSFLRLPGVRLPFLIGLARARDRWNGGQQSLVLEVFDARTGETLGWKDDIFADRLGQFAFNPQQQRLELSGFHTTIRLSFGPELLQVPTGEEPF